MTTDDAIVCGRWLLVVVILAVAVVLVGGVLVFGGYTETPGDDLPDRATPSPHIE